MVAGDADVNSYLDVNTVRNDLLACDGRPYLAHLYRFAKKNGFNVKFFLLPDIPVNSWSNLNNKVACFDFTGTDRNDYTSNTLNNFYDSEQLQQMIQAFRVDNKGYKGTSLYYSTSTLETYLAQKPFFWPGDTDLVLVDTKTYEPKAIFEFKKHTASSKIPFDKETLANYYRKDFMKYDSLTYLSRRLNTKLFLLFHSVCIEDDYVIIEELDTSKARLSVKSRNSFRQPTPADEEYERFASEIVCNYIR